MSRVLVALCGAVAACGTPPEDVAERFVVAREHGYARQAYDLLSQPDRDVRAYRAFERAQVRTVDERVERLLARRTKVRVEPVEVVRRTARMAVELVRVDVSEGSRKLIASELADGPAVASRLQKLDLPTKTSTESLRLVKEAAGWRVFLDLERQDKAARQSEVARLKRLGRSRMQDGHLDWARETYESAQRLAPSDPVIRHAIAALRSARTIDEAAAYRAKVVVDRVKVRARRITGEIRNTGDRSLGDVEVTVTGLDGRGAAVTEASARPVRVEGGGSVFLPGHSRPFVVDFLQPPAAWKGAVEVRVTAVRFSP